MATAEATSDRPSYSGFDRHGQTDDAFKSSFINRKADLEVDKFFRACVKLKASDLHLKVDKPPMVRVDGTLRPMNREPITDEEMVRLMLPADERAEPQDLREGRRRRLRPHARRRRHRSGGSA